MVFLGNRTHVSRVVPVWDLSDGLPTELLRRGFIILSYFRAIVVRHPLERVLSGYRYSLRDTSILPEINKKGLGYWIAER